MCSLRKSYGNSCQEAVHVPFESLFETFLMVRGEPTSICKSLLIKNTSRISRKSYILSLRNPYDNPFRKSLTDSFRNSCSDFLIKSKAHNSFRNFLRHFFHKFYIRFLDKFVQGFLWEIIFGLLPKLLQNNSRNEISKCVSETPTLVSFEVLLGIFYEIYPKLPLNIL